MRTLRAAGTTAEGTSGAVSANPAPITETVMHGVHGGKVVATIQPVHSYECRYWRIGLRHQPCSCGANTLWDDYMEIFGDNPWQVPFTHRKTAS